MIVIVYGTRPEFIKIFPVIDRLRKESVRHAVINTGQHGSVLKELERELDFTPDLSLDVVSQGVQDSGLFARLVTDISSAVLGFKPRILVSQGDTFTVLATSMVAFLKGIQHAHVEAGLRSHDLWKPFPEEFNRRVASLASSLHFAPTALARQNLLSEGVPENAIHTVGNTIVDMVGFVCERRGIRTGSEKLIYITTHRRENWGLPIRSIVRSIKGLCRDYGEYSFVWSMHPNPAIERDIKEEMGLSPSNLELRKAMGYFENLDMIARSSLILSDSGGIQEEAACLDKDILILREVTERPEVVDAGYATLCGHDPELIRAAFERIIGRTRFPVRQNPFGDGLSSNRIVSMIENAVRNV